MKKILSMLAIMLTIVLLGACNQTTSIERKAKSQMHKTMKELAKDPDSYKISNEKVIFSNDSTCVISFTGRGKNDFGAYHPTDYEYYYVVRHRKAGISTTEAVVNMEDDGFSGFTKQANKTYSEMKSDKNFIKSFSKEHPGIDAYSENGKNAFFSDVATIVSDIQGREVDND